MQSQHGILVMSSFDIRRDTGDLTPILEPFQLIHQVIDHHITYVMDLARWLSLPQQIGDRVRLCSEAKIRKRIGNYAVDFLRHAPIPASKAGFYVCDLYAGFLCNYRTCDGRVDVADDDDQVGSIPTANLLVRTHDSGSLLGVRSTANAQLEVGAWDAELVKKDVAHLDVVMLSCVNQRRRKQLSSLRHRTQDRRNLHEVWSRSGNKVYADSRSSGLEVGHHSRLRGDIMSNMEIPGNARVGRSSWRLRS